MNRLACTGLLFALVVGVGVVPAASASPVPVADGVSSARVAAVRVVAKVDKAEVTEGDRLTVKVKVPKAATARSVTLEELGADDIYGNSTWVKVEKRRAVRLTKFTVTVASENEAKYRAVVSYKKTPKPVKSNVVSVKVWRWIPMSEYRPYYESASYAMVFGSTTINGYPYTGWGVSVTSHTGAWESRFTPGRHCSSFRGVLGLGDVSDDGSSGSITFTADDAPIYQSPTLTPGMSVPVTVPLNNPYRFGIQLFDTTPGGTTGRDAVEAWPVIGDPAFLCTGV